MSDKKYCYAYYEEDGYSGPFDTAAAAQDAAVAAYTEENGHLPDEVWIAEVKEPRSFLNAEWIGEKVVEDIADHLNDEVGEASDNFMIAMANSHAVLGKMILDWIESYGGYHCFGLENSRAVAIVPAEIPE